MSPNVPHHFDRRPTDYPRKPCPKYGWRDDNGKPIHEIDETGTPICGRIRASTKTPCRRTLLAANGRCCAPGHGGNAPGGPLKHGLYSMHLPVRLAAKYQSVKDDDVLTLNRKNLVVLTSFLLDNLSAMGEESSAELWSKARKDFATLKAAMEGYDQAKTDKALKALDTALNTGSAVIDRQREVKDLTMKSAQLSKVELARLQKMHHFMTAEQMNANTANLLSILKKHVSPSILKKVATELGLVTDPETD